MGDPIVRTANVAMLFKLEAIEGVDAVPTATADAFPFEADGYSYNHPWTSEESREAAGSLVAGGPLIVGRAANISIRARMKGANTTYSASVKPPHHALLSACGMRGLFTAAIVAAALTAGTSTSATLGAAFAATARSYIGMPLILSGGAGAGRTANIAGYTAGKVATLTDEFTTPLDTTTLAEIPANWTYSGTSPRDQAARVTDHPSGTLYIYEDGNLLKFTGCRGRISNWGGQTARPGYFTFELTGTFAGIVEAAMPTDLVIAGHGAPVLAQGAGGVNPAFMVNRKGLPISQWAIEQAAALESPEDPNTPYGFGAAQIGERTPVLSIDPLASLVSNRNIIAEIGNLSEFNNVIRSTGAAGNRWSITQPRIQPIESDPGERGSMRSEDRRYRALDSGFDAVGRNTETVLCFY